MKRDKAEKAISIVLVAIILVASLLAFLIPPLITQKYDDELIIYNWADYIDLTVLDSFAEYYEELTGRSIKIVYSNFDTNETMITEIIKGDSNIDLICPSEYAIERLLRNNALQKLDWSVLDNYEVDSFTGNINSDILDVINNVFVNMEVKSGETVDMADYFLPYMYGTLGVLYNTNYLTAEEVAKEGWGIFWNTLQNNDIQSKILIKDSIRDTYAAAVLYLQSFGLLPAKYMEMTVEELINCTEDELVDLVEKSLKDQRQYLKGYEVDFGKDDMVNEIALVDLAWSGDAMYAIEEAMDDEGVSYLDYYVPEEGSNIWFDGWVMPKNAKNKDAAYLFMNYLCRPDIAMYNTLEIGYSAAVDNSSYFVEDEEDINYDYSVEAIEALLDCYEIYLEDFDTEEEYLEAVDEFYEEFFEDTRRYPDFEANLGMMTDFGEDNEKIVEMWERIKAYGESDNWVVLGIIIGALALIVCSAIGFVIWHLNKKPKSRRVE